MAVGCSPTKPPQRPMGTETRIGDNKAKRNNNNITNIDRRNMDNITDMTPNVKRNQVGPGPKTATDITQKK